VAYISNGGIKLTNVHSMGFTSDVVGSVGVVGVVGWVGVVGSAGSPQPPKMMADTSRIESITRKIRFTNYLLILGFKGVDFLFEPNYYTVMLTSFLFLQHYL
jgi:hypothetical protein